MSLRARRSQHWCRTEDVRTIKEGDMTAARWKIGAPPGIGNEEERSQKEAGLRLMNQDEVLTRTLTTMRDLETKMKTAPQITDAFHLCSDVPALCSNMYFIRYPQHSMNHREQFSTSEHCVVHSVSLPRKAVNSSNMIL